MGNLNPKMDSKSSGSPDAASNGGLTSPKGLCKGYALLSIILQNEGIPVVLSSLFMISLPTEFLTFG